LKKEIKKIEKDMEISAKKLSKREFVEKAPPEIVAQVKMKAESMRLKLEKLNQNLDFFESIDG
jgi:valyl-tRNA synthetase